MNDPEPIDWQHVHEGLRAGERRLHEAFVPVEETVNRILEERAARFIGLRKGAEQEPVEKLLVAQAGRERFVVNALAISEVFKIGPLVPVPGTGPELLGVTTLRGTFYSVLNPAAFLSEVAPSPEGVAWGIVLRHATLHLALGVETVHGMETVSAALLAATEENVVRVGVEIAILLDLPSLFERLETQNTSLH